ncbi:MAG: isocitrate/isopropylmalate dehydrogenase family protein [Bacillota bacterium]|jgi:isocitrate dehydrogenase (NAD+)|nr:isocitrate/isopropylmalate dehydrogenase family protein [Bacillota bacterium]NLL27132.1 isocitrate/isopropylmalate dehydrogenase family protein [Erysipelotrichia bacterium]
MKYVTLFEGDGIGPEITDSVIQIFNHLNIPITFEKYDIGQTLYEKEGILISQESIDSIKKNKVALKAPISTPIGKGFRSMNVHLRMMFDLYANIRPAKSYKQIKSRYSDIDLVVFRENTEDLYIGEEKKINDDEFIAIKKITRKASRRIIKLAFEYAIKNNRKKVTCVHKANILKLTDGLFLEEFNKIKADYPSIIANDLIVDNTCMQLVLKPENFDVLVMPNLYGDIISDLTSGLIGGLGLLPSVNMNDEYAIFEAVHGSALDIANKNIANPTAFILSACMMLEHLGFEKEATTIKEAIECTFNDLDNCTADLGGKASTLQYTQNIINNMAKKSIM